LFINNTKSQTWTTYTTANGLAGNSVTAIAFDAQGSKWFVNNFCDGGWFMSDTSNYISKFDGTTWTHYTTNDLFCNWIYTIAIDAQGNKWIGTEIAGVLKFDGTTWTTYTTANGLVNNNVRAIAIDAQGNKWFGTIGGISKFDGTTWTTYYNSFGWEQNYIYDMAIDNQGNIWLWTHGGVVKLSDVSTEITTINENHLNLYPNPVQNILNINLSGKTGELQVFDISGKCLLQEQITENENSVDVSCLENGIYFVRVMHDKQIFTGKIVKY